MNRSDFHKAYCKAYSKIADGTKEDVRNGKFPDLDKITTIEEFNRLSHSIYFENKYDLQKYPFSFAISAAAQIYARPYWDKHVKVPDLLIEINRMEFEQYERDVVAHSKSKFREKFENANKKHWWK